MEHIKVGVFASRSPYRPNGIGLSVVKLDRVEGNILHIVGHDMLDQTPVLDIKPLYACGRSDCRNALRLDGGIPEKIVRINSKFTELIKFSIVSFSSLVLSDKLPENYYLMRIL